MKASFLIVVLVLCSLFPQFSTSTAKEIKLVKSDILTWPRVTLPQFGCFLEKNFKHKHHKFNCSIKQYANEGDPCKAAYYESIELPVGLSEQVHPLIRSIDLSWEHGNLQMVVVSFKSKIKVEEIQKNFGLQKNEFNIRPNVQRYSILECNKDYNCLSLEGFDHIGAGDVDCGK